MEEKEFGIKYKVVKVDKDKYILVPLYLVSGESDAFVFTTDEGENVRIANYVDDLKNKFVVDKSFNLEELEEIYDYEYDGSDFLPKYFYENFKNTLIYVEADIKNDILKKNEINIKDFTEREYDLTYFMDKTVPVIALNGDALDELRGASSIEEMYVMLEKYKTHIEVFRDYFNKRGVTKINIENGKVKSFETSKRVETVKTSKETKVKPAVKKEVKNDFSYNGLCNYIKERVFGHDDEIDTLAKILYLNKTAQKEDGVESILITGPTGTGKTETIKAAASYLNIPYMEVNAANIVPQGIKGMSIEDVLSNLYIRSNYDLDKAERGLVFLDEFDKLNDNDLEIKGTVKDILLTFTQGGTFPIDNDQFSISFDTAMLSKVFAGVFDKIRDNKKLIGFAKQEEKNEDKEKELELRDKIIEKGYFSEEELSRINTILSYSDLDRETRKRILLYSKLSELNKKKNRYKRDYDIDIITEESYINAVLDEINKKNKGMRVVNNIVKKSLDEAEKEILKNSSKGYKRLVLTKNIVSNPKDFDIS